MITKLTKEQEAAIEVYYQEGIDICYDTKTDVSQAEKALNEIYKCCKLSIPKKIIWVGSPYMMQFAIDDVKQKQKPTAYKLDVQKKLENVDFFFYGYAQNEIHWIQYYRYYIQNFDIEIDKDAIVMLNIMFEIAKSSGWWYPFEDTIIVSQKPDFIQKNEKWHNESGPVISWPDGYAQFALNDTMVPRWIVETKPKDMNILKVMKIKNVQIRHEAVKKMDKYFYEKANAKLIESRFIYVDRKTNQVYTQYQKELGSLKCEVTTYDVNTGKMTKKNESRLYPVEYRLLEIDAGLPVKVKVLEMDNPSTNEKDYNYVTPECNSILDCFEMRTGERAFPLYLS